MGKLQLVTRKVLAKIVSAKHEEKTIGDSVRDLYTLTFIPQDKDITKVEASWFIGRVNEVRKNEDVRQLYMLSRLWDVKEPTRLVGKQALLLFISTDEKSLGKLYGIGRHKLYVVPSYIFRTNGKLTPRYYFWEDEVKKLAEAFEQEE